MDWNLQTLKEWVNTVRAPQPETYSDILKDVAALHFYSALGPDSQELWDHFLDILAFLATKDGGKERTTVIALTKTALPPSLTSPASLDMLHLHFTPWWGYRKTMYPKINELALYNMYKTLLAAPTVTATSEEGVKILPPPQKESAPLLQKESATTIGTKDLPSVIKGTSNNNSESNAFEE